MRRLLGGNSAKSKHVAAVPGVGALEAPGGDPAGGAPSADQKFLAELAVILAEEEEAKKREADKQQQQQREEQREDEEKVEDQSQQASEEQKPPDDNSKNVVESSGPVEDETPASKLSQDATDSSVADDFYSLPASSTNGSLIGNSPTFDSNPTDDTQGKDSASVDEEEEREGSKNESSKPLLILDNKASIEADVPPQEVAAFEPETTNADTSSIEEINRENTGDNTDHNAVASDMTTTADVHKNNTVGRAPEDLAVEPDMDTPGMEKPNNQISQPEQPSLDSNDVSSSIPIGEESDGMDQDDQANDDKAKPIIGDPTALIKEDVSEISSSIKSNAARDNNDDEVGESSTTPDSDKDPSAPLEQQILPDDVGESMANEENSNSNPNSIQHQQPKSPEHNHSSPESPEELNTSTVGQISIGEHDILPDSHHTNDRLNISEGQNPNLAATAAEPVTMEDNSIDQAKEQPSAGTEDATITIQDEVSDSAVPIVPSHERTDTDRGVAASVQHHSEAFPQETTAADNLGGAEPAAAQSDEVESSNHVNEIVHTANSASPKCMEESSFRSREEGEGSTLSCLPDTIPGTPSPAAEGDEAAGSHGEGGLNDGPASVAQQSKELEISSCDKKADGLSDSQSTGNIESETNANESYAEASVATKEVTTTPAETTTIDTTAFQTGERERIVNDTMAANSDVCSSDTAGSAGPQHDGDNPNGQNDEGIQATAETNVEPESSGHAQENIGHLKKEYENNQSTKEDDVERINEVGNSQSHRRGELANNRESNTRADADSASLSEEHEHDAGETPPASVPIDSEPSTDETPQSGFDVNATCDSTTDTNGLGNKDRTWGENGLRVEKLDQAPRDISALPADSECSETDVPRGERALTDHEEASELRSPHPTPQSPDYLVDDPKTPAAAPFPAVRLDAQVSEPTIDSGRADFAEASGTVGGETSEATQRQATVGNRNDEQARIPGSGVSEPGNLSESLNGESLKSLQEYGPTTGQLDFDERIRIPDSKATRSDQSLDQTNNDNEKVGSPEPLCEAAPGELKELPNDLTVRSKGSTAVAATRDLVGKPEILEAPHLQEVDAEVSERVSGTEQPKQPQPTPDDTPILETTGRTSDPKESASVRSHMSSDQAPGKHDTNEDGNQKKALGESSNTDAMPLSDPVVDGNEHAMDTAQSAHSHSEGNLWMEKQHTEDNLQVTEGLQDSDEKKLTEPVDSSINSGGQSNDAKGSKGAPPKIEPPSDSAMVAKYADDDQNGKISTEQRPDIREDAEETSAGNRGSSSSHHVSDSIFDDFEQIKSSFRRLVSATSSTAATVSEETTHALSSTAATVSEVTAPARAQAGNVVTSSATAASGIIQTCRRELKKRRSERNMIVSFVQEKRRSMERFSLRKEGGLDGLDLSLSLHDSTALHDSRLLAADESDEEEANSILAQLRSSSRSDLDQYRNEVSLFLKDTPNRNSRRGSGNTPSKRQSLVGKHLEEQFEDEEGPNNEDPVLKAALAGAEARKLRIRQKRLDEMQASSEEGKELLTSFKRLKDITVSTAAAVASAASPALQEAKDIAADFAGSSDPDEEEVIIVGDAAPDIPLGSRVFSATSVIIERNSKDVEGKTPIFPGLLVSNTAPSKNTNAVKKVASTANAKSSIAAIKPGGIAHQLGLEESKHAFTTPRVFVDFVAQKLKVGEMETGIVTEETTAERKERLEGHHVNGSIFLNERRYSSSSSLSSPCSPDLLSLSSEVSDNDSQQHSLSTASTPVKDFAAATPGVSFWDMVSHSTAAASEPSQPASSKTMSAPSSTQLLDEHKQSSVSFDMDSPKRLSLPKVTVASPRRSSGSKLTLDELVQENGSSDVVVMETHVEHHEESERSDLGIELLPKQTVDLCNHVLQEAGKEMGQLEVEKAATFPLKSPISTVVETPDESERSEGAFDLPIVVKKPEDEREDAGQENNNASTEKTANDRTVELEKVVGVEEEAQDVARRSRDQATENDESNAIENQLISTAAFSFASARHKEMTVESKTASNVRSNEKENSLANSCDNIPDDAISEAEAPPVTTTPMSSEFVGFSFESPAAVSNVSNLMQTPGGLSLESPGDASSLQQPIIIQSSGQQAPFVAKKRQRQSGSSSAQPLAVRSVKSDIDFEDTDSASLGFFSVPSQFNENGSGILHVGNKRARDRVSSPQGSVNWATGSLTGNLSFSGGKTGSRHTGRRKRDSRRRSVNRRSTKQLFMDGSFSQFSSSQLDLGGSRHELASGNPDTLSSSHRSQHGNQEVQVSGLRRSLSGNELLLLPSSETGASMMFPDGPDLDDISDAGGLLDLALMAFSSVTNTKIFNTEKKPTMPKEVQYIASVRWRQLVSKWKHTTLAKALTERPCSVHYRKDQVNDGMSDDDDDESTISTGRPRGNSGLDLLNFQNSAAGILSETKNLNGVIPHLADGEMETLSGFLEAIGSANGVTCEFEKHSGSGEAKLAHVLPKVTRKTTVSSLVELAESNLKTFAELLRDLANVVRVSDPSESAVSYSIGVKAKESIRKKARRKYEGDILRVKDVLRGEMVFADESWLVVGLLHLHRLCMKKRGKTTLEIVRVKNLFHKSVSGVLCSSMLPTGYRHVLVNLRLNGLLLAEIQFQLADMLEILGYEGYNLHSEILDLEDAFHSSLVRSANNSPTKQTSDESTRKCDISELSPKKPLETQESSGAPLPTTKPITTKEVSNTRPSVSKMEVNKLKSDQAKDDSPKADARSEVNTLKLDQARAASPKDIAQPLAHAKKDSTENKDRSVEPPHDPVDTKAPNSQDENLGSAVEVEPTKRSSESPPDLSESGLVSINLFEDENKLEHLKQLRKTACDYSKEQIMQAIKSKGIQVAGDHPRDVPVFFCLYFLLMLEIGHVSQCSETWMLLFSGADYWPLVDHHKSKDHDGLGSRCGKVKVPPQTTATREGESPGKKSGESRPSAHSKAILAMSRQCLLRSLAVSNQGTSVGMTGWLEYGAGNSFGRITNVPFLALRELAHTFAAGGDWQGAIEVLRCQISRCDQHLPLYHPTTLSSMLDMAGVAQKAENPAMASIFLEEAGTRLSLYLAEQEERCFCQNSSTPLEEEMRNEEVQLQFENGHDAVSMLRAFVDSFQTHFDREFCQLLGYDGEGKPNHILLFSHLFFADALSVLANCASAGETSENSMTRSQLHWHAAYQQYEIAFKGFLLNRRKLSDDQVVSAACGAARCLRQLKERGKASQLLSSIVAAMGREKSQPSSYVEDEPSMSEPGKDSPRKAIIPQKGALRLSFVPCKGATSMRLRLTEHDRSQKRNELCMAHCLWLMSIFAVEDSPNERGRMRGLSLLHAASEALQRVVEQESTPALPGLAKDSFTARPLSYRESCQDLLVRIEQEAKDLLEPVEDAVVEAATHHGPSLSESNHSGVMI